MLWYRLASEEAMILLWYSEISYRVCREVGETCCIQLEDDRGRWKYTQRVSCKRWYDYKNSFFIILLLTHQIYSFLSRLMYSKLRSLQILSVGQMYLPLDSKQLKPTRILICVHVGYVRACLCVCSIYISCFSKYWSWYCKMLWYWRGKQFCRGRRACDCRDIFDIPLPVLMSRLWPC